MSRVRILLDRLVMVMLMIGVTITVFSSANIAMAGSLPASYTIDTANILSSSTKQHIADVNAGLESQHDGAQLLVVTVPSLKGDTIENVSMSYAEKYKPGTQGKDNGLVYIIAESDHKDRLEVGYGLEGTIPDAKAGEIIDSAHGYYKNNDWNAGVTSVVDNVNNTLGGKPVSKPEKTISTGWLSNFLVNFVAAFVPIVVVSIITISFLFVFGYPVYRKFKKKYIKSKANKLGILRNKGFDDDSIDDMLEALIKSKSSSVTSMRRCYEKYVSYKAIDKYYIGQQTVMGFLEGIDDAEKDSYWSSDNIMDIDRFSTDVKPFAKNCLRKVYNLLIEAHINKLPLVDDKGMLFISSKVLNHDYRVFKASTLKDSQLKFKSIRKSLIVEASAAYLMRYVPVLAANNGGEHAPEDYRKLFSDDNPKADVVANAAAMKWASDGLDSAIRFIDNRIEFDNGFDEAYDSMEKVKSDKRINVESARKDVKKKLEELSDSGILVRIDVASLWAMADIVRISRTSGSSGGGSSSGGSSSSSSGGGSFGGGGASGSW